MGVRGGGRCGGRDGTREAGQRGPGVLVRESVEAWEGQGAPVRAERRSRRRLR